LFTVYKLFEKQKVNFVVYIFGKVIEESSVVTGGLMAGISAVEAVGKLPPQEHESVASSDDSIRYSLVVFYIYI
jgi:ribosomal protein L10